MPEHALRLLLAAFGCAMLAVFLSLLIGSTDIPAGEVMRHLLSNDGSIADRIIDELRLPRTLSAFSIGGVLALAGALMQVLLRNPLGDPYVLGVSGGAASAVLLAMLFGLPLLALAPVAFLGALASMLLVFAIGYRAQQHDTTRLLLSGVVLAAGWSALISLILALSPAAQLPGMLFWLMGDLSDALSPLVPGSVLIIGLILAMHLAPQLNLAAYGLAQAAVLGVNPQRLRLWLFVLSSLLTAAAVSQAGAIGFIGLVIPHLVRLAGGSDHRVLLPVSALLGGSLLCVADLIARTLIAPVQLPVGILTALLGIPIFLWLLTRSRRA